jgi:hypothetical protein
MASGAARPHHLDQLGIEGVEIDVCASTDDAVVQLQRDVSSARVSGRCRSVIMRVAGRRWSIRDAAPDGVPVSPVSNGTRSARAPDRCRQ